MVLPKCYNFPLSSRPHAFSRRPYVDRVWNCRLMSGSFEIISRLSKLNRTHGGG